MKSHERQTRIVEQLRLGSYASVGELSRLLGVSEMTIRRDLDQLERMNLLARCHGGASLSPGKGDLEWPWLLRETVNAGEKRLIGRTAAALVQPGDVVFLDGGSTTLEVAQHLKQANLTVVSNSVRILSYVSSQRHINLVGIGGTLLWDNQSFVGPWAFDILRSISTNIAIMGTTCLSLDKGMTNLNVDEAVIKRAAIERAAKVVLVTDSSKMHTHTLAAVGPVEMIHVLVTDAGLAAADREALTARGVEVMIADE